MTGSVEFEKILKLFESPGWVLQKIWPPYRVFMKEGELPFLIPVHEGKVNDEYVKKINDYFEGKEGCDLG
jgi:hypothetical protein